MNKDPTKVYPRITSNGYYSSPDRPRFTRGNQRSIITTVLNRIAVDVVATASIRHVHLDDKDRYSEDADSDHNYCLTTETNIDQTGRALLQGIAMSLLDEGTVAIVPINTPDNLFMTSGFDIQSLRVGKVVKYFPRDILVRVYNDRTSEHKEIIML